jgi:single-strand DNA-binding protein
MSKTSGLFRLGRDAELRYLNDGTAVAKVALAFNHGMKDQEGNRKTQWIDASLFGARAETLAPMLLKGSQHVFHLADCHVETYQKKEGGEGVSLVGRIEDIELTDRRDVPQQPQRQAAPQQSRQAPPQRQAAPAQRQAQAPAGRGGSGFENMDDDIPFNDPMSSRAFCLACA